MRVRVHVTDGAAGTDAGFVDGTGHSGARPGFPAGSARPAVPTPSLHVWVCLLPELLSGNSVLHAVFTTTCCRRWRHNYLCALTLTYIF